ncbi:hypothetical protein BDY21DRAFT_77654 [Lineolata rhizophorae]|uniref:Uncharacterized protein n=1 Tax=Lineolata rhizophorae TaxID=578093 RepID=A0A6A6NUV1_9PEZI|nr:hypothetical protein BDY21DRAFT_77654 [Lineolata rhizophorae]
MEENLQCVCLRPFFSPRRKTRTGLPVAYQKYYVQYIPATIEDQPYTTYQRKSHPPSPLATPSLAYTARFKQVPKHIRPVACNLLGQVTQLATPDASPSTQAGPGRDPGSAKPRSRSARLNANRKACPWMAPGRQRLWRRGVGGGDEALPADYVHTVPMYVCVLAAFAITRAGATYVVRSRFVAGRAMGGSREIDPGGGVYVHRRVCRSSRVRRSAGF